MSMAAGMGGSQYFPGGIGAAPLGRPRRMQLERALNGGWVLHVDPEDRGVIQPVTAAFSSDDDLLKGLEDILVVARASQQGGAA